MLDGGKEVVAESVMQGLRARGHVVADWSSHAVTQLVLQDPDDRVLSAVSDRRKGGLAAGYD